MFNMENKVLFIGATHGDEPIGVQVLEEVSQVKKGVCYLTGNPRAFKLGQRFTEVDLNRSAPGSANSLIYEQRRANELLSLSKNYTYTIDIHGTYRKTGIFIIITNPTDKNLMLAKKFNIKRIVIWPPFSSELKGALSEYFPCGLELECGQKDNGKTLKQLKIILINFLDNIAEGRAVSLKQEVYQVYGSINVSEKPPAINKWNEFVMTKWRGESFYPLLINSYSKRNNIYCYKMRRVK